MEKTKLRQTNFEISLSRKLDQVALEILGAYGAGEDYDSIDEGFLANPDHLEGDMNWSH